LIKQAKKRLPDRPLALAYGAAGFSGSGSIGCRGVPVSQMLKEVANLKHITVTLATWDAVWEVYLDPNVEVVPAGSPPAFLVLASDGLWDVVSEGRVAALLAKAAAKEGDGQLWAQEAADLLLKQAVDGRSKDDISIMVLCLQPGKKK
ncbi:uncharacterized protein HaLaN_09598, partial [Haematococcus lacustris]